MKTEYESDKIILVAENMEEATYLVKASLEELHEKYGLPSDGKEIVKDCISFSKK